MRRQKIFLLLNNRHIHTQLVKEPGNISTWHSINNDPGNFIISDNIAPMLFRQRDRLAHLWDRWEAQWRKNEAGSLSSSDLRRRLHPHHLSFLLHFLYIMHMESQV